MEFITRRPWAVAPKRSEGATKGLRVINYVETLLDPIVPLQLHVTTKQRENVAVISNSIDSLVIISFFNAHL